MQFQFYPKKWGLSHHKDAEFFAGVPYPIFTHVLVIGPLQFWWVSW